MIEIATPISTLFNKLINAIEIIKYSDCLECREQSFHSTFSNQKVFHCDIQLIHKFGRDKFSFLEKLADLKKELQLISFHMASSCSNPFLDNFMFKPGGFQLSRKEMLNNAKKNIKIIKSIFEPEVKIAVENNNYYPSEAYNYITDSKFISEVVYDNDIYFLYDMAHAGITAHNKCLLLQDYQIQLPLDRVIQVHISRYKKNRDNIAIDSHLLPDTNEYNELLKIISIAKSIEYVTIEYYKDINRLIASLKKLRKFLYELS